MRDLIEQNDMADIVHIHKPVQANLQDDFGYLAKDIPEDQRVHLFLAIIGCEHGGVPPGGRKRSLHGIDTNYRRSALAVRNIGALSLARRRIYNGNLHQNSILGKSA